MGSGYKEGGWGLGTRRENGIWVQGGRMGSGYKEGGKGLGTMREEGEEFKVFGVLWIRFV